MLAPRGARFVGLCALLTASSALLAGAQDALPSPTVQARWATDQFIGNRSVLEFDLSAPLEATAGRLAIMVGTLDVSALLEVSGVQVRYRPSAMRLPTGESQAAVYLVNAAGEWRELGRFPLRVRSRAGVDQGNLVPSADLSSNGQLGQESPAPSLDRGAYQDLTLRFGVETSIRRAPWQVSVQANALGVTEKTQRLRFGEMQQDAPPLDLADYRVQFTNGPTQVSLGNVIIGNNRYLASGFGSRGASGRVQIGSAVAVDAGVVNGTSVVGWGNPLGISRPEHRLSSVTVGAELIPARPGALHVDVSGFNGAVLPFSGFNQGAATDAEESRGLGAQLSFSDADQRLRFTGGFAQSRFDNPVDPLLTGDTTLVPVLSTTRNARFGELGLQLLRGVPIATAWPLSLAATVRHERVDPLYRSVGASVQSDVENSGVDLNLNLGQVGLTAAMSGTRDNLAEIASVLTSRTRTRNINGSLPLGAIIGANGQQWIWPAINVSWQSTRQYGEGVPSNGEFSASHVPDQVNVMRSANATWNRGAWNLAYRWISAHQDNRQTGRELADFRSTGHAVSLAGSPATWLTSSIDLSAERQEHLETSTVQRVKRVAASAQLLLTRFTSMTGSLSQSWGFDPFAQQRTRNTESHVELSQGFTAWRKQDNGTQGRVFIRYARTRAASLPFTAAGLAPLVTWNLTAGSSLRLY